MNNLLNLRRCRFHVTGQLFIANTSCRRFAGAVGLAEYVFLDGARPVPSLNVEARGGSRSADVLDKVKLLVQVIQDPTQFMDDE